MKKPSRTIKLRTAVLACLITFMFGIGIQFVAAKSETSWGLLYQVLGIVRTQFVKKDISDQTLIYGSIKGLLKSLDDPYTRFVEPDAFKEMQVQLKGSFAGIGIQIGLKDQHLTVISPIKDTPAEKAGLKAGDMIVKIEDKSTEDMSLQEAVSLIRGEKGSKVKIEVVRPKQKPKAYYIVRDNIKLNAVYKSEMIDEKNKIGYIYLTTFESTETTQEVIDALKALDKKGMRSLILDVRNNGGGLLDQAVQLVSLFVKDGAVVHTVDRYGNRETLETVEVEYAWQTKPMIVLVNGASASASEILAGALHDHKRATVLGSKTFGKASVQNIRPLSDGSAVLVTVAKYLTPDGIDINKTGLTPNIREEVPTAALEEAMKPDYTYDAKKDNQLQAAIKLLRNGSIK